MWYQRPPIANHEEQGPGGDPAELPRKRAVVAVSEPRSYDVHAVGRTHALTERYVLVRSLSQSQVKMRWCETEMSTVSRSQPGMHLP